MRTFFFSAFVAFAVLCSISTTQAQTPKNDFEIWNETNFVLPIVRSKDEKGKTVDRLSLLLLTNLRLGQNRAIPVDERIGLGLEIPLNKYFTFTPAYLYVATQPGRFRREFEHRIRFELAYAYKFSRFTFKNRGRIEYRVRNSHEDTVRYRNQFSIHVPVRRNDKELFVPFISTEPYFDFTLKRFTRNDLAVGITKKLNERITAMFFTGWRHNVFGLPQEVFPVGVNLKIKLR